MHLTNTKADFGLVSKVIHWLMALLIISLITIALYMDSLPRGSEKFELIGTHKALGFIALCAIFIRLIWHRISSPPAPLGHGKPLLLAKIGHGLLYLMMLLMPISGALMSVSAGYDITVFGWFTVPGFSEKTPWLNELSHSLHEFGAKGLYALIIGHIAAALYHHFIVKDATLKRMTHS